MRAYYVEFAAKHGARPDDLHMALNSDKYRIGTAPSALLAGAEVGYAVAVPLRKPYPPAAITGNPIGNKQGG